MSLDDIRADKRYKDGHWDASYKCYTDSKHLKKIFQPKSKWFE
ncbi:hypothetical protein [Streptococcus salivarius]|nr:hypothetical protein [Streptococcus salivarius]